jgi:hypothetical protein
MSPVGSRAAGNPAILRHIARSIRVEPGQAARLDRRDPGATLGLDKGTAGPTLAIQFDRLSALQDRLWAEAERAVLVLLRASTVPARTV